MTTRTRIERLENELGRNTDCPACGRPLHQAENAGAKSTDEFTELLRFADVSQLEAIAEAQRTVSDIFQDLQARRERS